MSPQTLLKTKMTCIAVLSASLIAGVPLPARADYPGYGLSKTYQSCSAKSVSYIESIECMEHEAKRMTQRMQQAQTKRLRNADGEEQKKWMMQSQAFWQQHKQAECQSVWSPGSGNSRDVATECNMLKTARRVMELESQKR